MSADAFEAHRPRLRALAYRMLGSLAEAEDAVQEAWLRYERSDTSEVEDLGAWLRTVVARVCLNALRSRETRREVELGPHVPDPVVSPADGGDPEHEALLADAVGLALGVVLESLGPAERLAFVLHDMFAVPFGDIASMIDRTPEATRQLASRARRRVRDAVPAPDPDPAGQRAAAEAFLAASRAGDLERLVAVLHPDVELHVQNQRGGRVVRGADAVATGAATFQRLRDPKDVTYVARVNGAAGLVTVHDGRAVGVVGMTVVDGRIVRLDILADPVRLRRVDLAGIV